MKNNTLSGRYCFKNPRFKQIFRIMRISTFLLMVCVFCSYAGNAHSQNAKVSIRMNNVKLDKILNEIENQTDYLFIYNNQVDINKITSVKVKNEAVAQVLDRILSGTGINYELEGTHIILTTEAIKDLHAQQQAKTVTGTVTDVSGEPIIGANIRIKGTTTGTITDIDGNFSIEAEPQSVIEVSYIGYLTQETVINNQKSIRFLLKEDTKTLDEVVVIGYGVQKKADLTGSVANINTEKLNTQSNANIGQALQGKIAGVDIVSQGGAPGSGTRIMVRGIGTLNNASPLYIVDGMYMNSIDHINPNDIASIDVLKDASSAAIYGSRAANGVIIVTTKEGSNTEGKPIIDLSVNLGISTASKFLDMLDAKGWAEVTTIARQAIGKPALDMATDLANKPDNDWQDIMFRPALMQNYNLAVKGGGKYSTYYTGLGYFNQDGIVKGTNYQRYNIQSKNDYKRGIFSAGTNLIISFSHDKPLHQELRGGMIGTILQSVPTLEKYDDTREGGYGGTYGDVVNIPHPLAIIDDNIMDRYNENVKIFANLYAQIELFKGLKYKLNLTPDFSFERYKNYLNKYDFGLATNSITQLTERQRRRRNILVENLLTFDRTFGEHKISALAGYTYQDSRFRHIQAYGEGLPQGLEEIDAATTNRSNEGNSWRSVLTSILGRVFYSYQNKYLFTATIRRDGSSKFGKNNRYGYFPSFSLGWNVAEEKFMENVHWLDQLKLRGGYGVLGNQEIDNYQYSSTITTGINYPDGNGGLLQGAFPKNFANPDIKWEETAMTNVGIDFMAFNNRLSLTADYYVKNTKDILLTVPIPISSGGANDPIRNAGKIRNNGFEFNLGWMDQPNPDISYGINLIGSFNKNKVIAMGSESGSIKGGSTNQNITTSETKAGYPIGGYWLISTAGYFNSQEEVDAYAKDGKKIQPAAEPGDIKFVDANNDGVINDDDRVFQGSPFPDFTFALNGNMRYKNFDLSIGLQGVLGNKIYNATRQTLEDVTKGSNFLASCLDYWTPENKNASHPRLTWDDPNRNTRAESDRYLENGSYLRLRSVQLGYTFPQTWFKGAIQHARVYINAENLFTITSYSGYSPDVNADNANYRGFDNFIYPTNRTFMLGLNVTF
ncbi:TonB-dependent receptor [Phocaeicola vulgatus]|jgi:TonB-linked SusC/RagA family outer membrane protein|uniref:TonB-dependent receptor n=1 Tax=Phocaeicola vulgatus TaxID=821 RepID=UPI000E46DDAC|nr:TonB-dependent receptor [Phocaeicola vulgatus]RGR04685.1 SusC/RagA family TonB-linked outer membrane protein [Phocaeicola vulgatus]RGU60336.1 SusC/RagA family TonB-linked outer membrane protein [Phocaeicola vulgatus]RGU68244.1 SusC/RagA family TonB-linked outer membrane protein [Phocaeicola vulgatus]